MTRGSSPGAPPGSYGHRLYAVVFAFLLILAAVIRIVNMLGEDFWYDEGYTLYFTDPHLGSAADKIVYHAHRDPHPLLYFLAVDFWRRISDSMAWLRLSSIVAMLSAIAIVWRIGARNATPVAALVAVAFLAVSRMGVFYSLELRMYALGCLFAAASLFFFLRVMLSEEAIRKRDVAGLALANGLLMLTHYTGAFFPMCEFGALLFAPRATDDYTRAKERLMAVTIAMVGSALVFMLQLPWFLMQSAAVSEFFWLHPPTLVDFSVTLHRLLIGKGYRFGLGWPNLIKIALYFAMVASLVGFALWRRRRLEWVLVCCAMGPLVLSWVASHVASPVFLWRSFLYTLIPMSLLVGVAVSYSIERARQTTGLSRVFPVALMSLCAYLLFTNVWGLPWDMKTRHRANFSQLIAEVEELITDETLIVLAPNMIEGAIQYASRNSATVKEAPTYRFPHPVAETPATGADPGFSVPTKDEWDRFREACFAYERIVIVQQYTVGDFVFPELSNVVRQTHTHFHRRHHYGGDVDVLVYDKSVPD